MQLVFQSGFGAVLYNEVARHQLIGSECKHQYYLYDQNSNSHNNPACNTNSNFNVIQDLCNIEMKLSLIISTRRNQLAIWL